MRTLLFDIDGTLLVTDEGGKTALQSALTDEFDLHEVNVAIDFAGRTDRSLFRELLILNDLEPTELNQKRLADSYAKRLPSVLRQRGGTVLPGVRRLLDLLSGHADTLPYVMTGNLRKTATHKLSHFGLSHYFHGVFGGDHDLERVSLARRTLTDLCDRHGKQRLGELIVIGDTPQDIRCGHAIGAKVVAVCTGAYDRPTLEAENPSAVCDDFADFNSIHKLLT